MDLVKRSSVTPSKTRLARTFAKVLHIRALTGVVPKTKPHEKLLQTFDEEDEKQNKASMEAFIAKLFANISSAKAAYAQMQFAQSPYNAEGIQSADQVFVSMLTKLSELKQCYLKKHLDDSSPETTMLLAEIQEHKCLSTTYEITIKNLDSQLRLKNSEIIFLREKLEEANRENKLIEKRLNFSGSLSIPDNLHLSGLNPTHFITALRQATKSIRSFVRVLVNEMESAGWDLDAAAGSIEPGVVYSSDTHKCFAFESFVCSKMFDGFNYPNFSLSSGSLPEKKKQQRLYFSRFMEFKSLKPKEYLDWKPKSTFSKFWRKKYLNLVHSKMEFSLLGDLKQRGLVNSGEYPETTFFCVFTEMAKRVWLLHCLGFCFEDGTEIFEVSKRSRFSEVYMQSVSEDVLLSSGTDHRVCFTVVPGFKIGKTVVQSQVYLC